MPTMWAGGPVSLTARCGVHAPGVCVSAASALTTHTRLAATTLISVGWAAQPPTGELRVPKTTYTRPVCWSTTMLDGPPESAHCRSR